MNKESKTGIEQVAHQGGGEPAQVQPTELLRREEVTRTLTAGRSRGAGHESKCFSFPISAFCIQRFTTQLSTINN